MRETARIWMTSLLLIAAATPVYADENANILAIWANDGGDKVVRSDIRALEDPQSVINSVWDGTTVRLFSAKNEFVSFNLVLELSRRGARGVSIAFNELNGPNGAKITSKPTDRSGLFNWVDRNIELFKVEYLQIVGLSTIGYEFYDERHIPARLRRPWVGEGKGHGTSRDRPDMNQYYPDIAVPIEAVPDFRTERGADNQSIWADIYVPRDSATGLYRGTVVITETGKNGSPVIHTVPVELTVRDFALPDTPTAKTMLFLGDDVPVRYLNEQVADTTHPTELNLIRDRHFMMAHRHKVSLVDSNLGPGAATPDQPRPEWKRRLDGSLFVPANGYAGPGVGVGTGVYLIGMYGSWSWKDQGEAGMHQHTDAWANWFAQNAPGTEVYLYLTDEPKAEDYPLVERWASWVRSNKGPGKAIRSFSTIQYPHSEFVPSLDIYATIPQIVWGTAERHAERVAKLREEPRRKIVAYNGRRPVSGTFMIDDDGVALRLLPWTQVKMGVDRWFYWESTYYNNYQAGLTGPVAQVDVFRVAQNFGRAERIDPSVGATGANYANGDGLLFYPGTDKQHPESSYDLGGPIASLRLKHWRRGLQDADYLALARAKNPARTQAIIRRMAPKVLWEVGVTDANDPTWGTCDISWSTNPDDWEAARRELADIIEGK